MDLVVATSLKIEDAFKYPLRSLPLSIATTERALRQSDKDLFRLMSESHSNSNEIPTDCAWLFDVRVFDVIEDFLGSKSKYGSRHAMARVFT